MVLPTCVQESLLRLGSDGDELMALDDEEEDPVNVNHNLQWFIPPPPPRSDDVEISPVFDVIRSEVAETLTAVTYSIARGLRPDPHPVRPKLPDPYKPKSEVEVVVNKGSTPPPLHCMYPPLT